MDELSFKILSFKNHASYREIEAYLGDRVVGFTGYMEEDIPGFSNGKIAKMTLLGNVEDIVVIMEDKGFGSRLLDFAIQEAKKEGYESFFISDATKTGFYEKVLTRLSLEKVVLGYELLNNMVLNPAGKQRSSIGYLVHLVK